MIATEILVAITSPLNDDSIKPVRFALPPDFSPLIRLNNRIAGLRLIEKCISSHTANYTTEQNSNEQTPHKANSMPICRPLARSYRFPPSAC